MATTSAKKKMDELLAGSLDREFFDQMVQHVYESYANFDQAQEVVKSMEAGRQRASGEELRDLTEKLGILRFALGDYEQAAQDLDSIKTRKTAAHFLGRTFLKTHREQEALDLLEKGRTGEDDLGSDVLLVEAYCSLGQPEKAEELLKKYKSAEKSADLLYARARTAEANGEYGEAMGLYSAAIEKEPAHAASIFRLALNCDLNGEDARAVELYKLCASLRPAFVGPLLNLGILYEDQGNYYEAIECYKRVLAIEPRHKQAQLYLKDAESSLTMYIDVSRSKRLQRIDEFFGVPADSGDELEEGEGPFALMAGQDEDMLGGMEESPELEQKLNTSVEELDLSTRSRKCMDRLGITTVGELVQHTEEDLLATPNFGSTSVNEVKTKLAGLGLSLKGE
jgi:DNA-directed RNA polymerase subunit alpha